MKTTIAVILSLWVMTPGLRAQDDGQQPQESGQQAQPAAQGQPAAQTPSGSTAPPPGLQNPLGTQTETESQQGATPTDTRPLAGAEAITPTLPTAGRSYLIPSLSLWEAGDDNPRLVEGYSKVAFAAIPAGSLDFHLMGKHNNFDVDYGGGALLFESNFSDSAAFDNIQITDQYTARRWNFFISDRASYLPEGVLGFGGIGFAGIYNNSEALGIGTGGAQLNGFYTPEQSFLTGYAGTTSDTAITQFQYFVTPRTSVSVMGALGYQHYTQSGLFSGNDRFGVLSLDHQFTPTQSLSFSYSVMQLRFDGGSVAVNDDLWRLGYGYRVTNHFTLTLIAGPQLTFTAITGVPSSVRRLSWSGQGRLGYRAQRGEMSVSYLHYLTPGSGIFQGAETTLINASGNRELSRRWAGNIGVAWTRTGAASGLSTNPSFRGVGNVNYEYGNAKLTYNLSPSTRLFANYELQHQVAGVALVRGGSSRYLNTQVFGVGIAWHPRPFGL